jgi:hypothetical protein
VLEIRGNLDFREESFDAEYGAKVRFEDLESYGTIVPSIVGEINGGHASGTYLSLDLVAIGE